MKQFNVPRSIQIFLSFDLNTSSLSIEKYKVYWLGGVLMCGIKRKLLAFKKVIIFTLPNMVAYLNITVPSYWGLQNKLIYKKSIKCFQNNMQVYEMSRFPLVLNDIKLHHIFYMLHCVY